MVAYVQVLVRNLSHGWGAVLDDGRGLCGRVGGDPLEEVLRAVREHLLGGREYRLGRAG